ncbi:MAG: hypothetical protein N2Z80_03260 [Hydrogenothermaceae bacterium]|nr:hypothetical protein [Hydrogenothermaceae bacterium]
MKKDEKQVIVFIDPKGLEHTKGLDDEKLQFSKYLKEELGGKIECVNVVFDAFILSVTPYTELVRGMISPPEKTEYEKFNVLFEEDRDWACKLLLGVKKLIP